MNNRNNNNDNQPGPDHRRRPASRPPRLQRFEHGRRKETVAHAKKRGRQAGNSEGGSKNEPPATAMSRAALHGMGCAHGARTTPRARTARTRHQRTLEQEVIVAGFAHLYFLLPEVLACNVQPHRTTPPGLRANETTNFARIREPLRRCPQSAVPLHAERLRVSRVT